MFNPGSMTTVECGVLMGQKIVNLHGLEYRQLIYDIDNRNFEIIWYGNVKYISKSNPVYKYFSVNEYNLGRVFHVDISLHSVHQLKLKM